MFYLEEEFNENFAICLTETATNEKPGVNNSTLSVRLRKYLCL